MFSQQLFFSITVSLILTMIMIPILIPIMKYLKYGQSIREEGPTSHYRKSGTPTMGGLVFVFSSVLTLAFYYLFYADTLDANWNVLTLLFFPFIAFSIIGFIDDYLIVVKKNNQGLQPLIKIILELIIAALFFRMYLKLGFNTTLSLFRFTVDFKWFYGVLIFFMLIGTANGVNLSDGLDGLAGGLAAIAIATFTFFAFKARHVEVMLAGGAVFGSILGFLIFNLYPAKIFMGDTGSLALGAFLAAMAILLKREWMLILVGGVFVIETLSVILQVTYFKRTKGKRLFRMTPIHHHFELIGISETRVVLLFYIVGIIFSFLAILMTLM